MKRLKINISGGCETKWIGNGDFQSDNFRMIYAGGEKHKRSIGILLDEERNNGPTGHWQITERIMLVKLKGNPLNTSIKMVYAPTSDSADEEIEEFYDTLDKPKAQCKSRNIIIVMGDLNTKVGNKGEEVVVGNYGLGERNDRGERWVQWWAANDLVITNTWFEE